MKLRKAKYSYLTMVLCGLFCFLFSNQLQAQLRIGPKVGFQMGRSVYEDADYREEYSSGFRPGLALGGFVNYRVNKILSLQTEVFYSQKGKRTLYKGNDPYNFTKNTATYDYIDIPVLLRISHHKTYRKTKLEYYVNIGPNLNYWLGGRGTMQSEEYYEFFDKTKIKYRVRFDNEPRDNEFSVVVNDANRVQMSLDFGAGVIFDLGLGHSIMIDFRNSLGIGKTYMGKKDSGNYGLYFYQDNFEAVNHVFAVSIGYLIDVDVQAFLQKGRFRR